jgi:hypothetical protein
LSKNASGSIFGAIAKLLLLGFGLLLLFGGGICGIFFLSQGGPIGFIPGILALMGAFWGLSIAMSAGASKKTQYFNKPMNRKHND